MGRPKENLPWRGSTLIERKVSELGGGFDEVLIATSRPERLPLALRSHAVPDRGPDCGPLAGIEAGLAAARNEIVVAVACDMPHVDLNLAEVLIARLGGYEAAVPFVGRRPDPLCAAYRRATLTAVTATLDEASTAGRVARASALLDRLRVRYVGSLEFRLYGLDERLLLNVNTPEDYQVLVTDP